MNKEIVNKVAKSGLVTIDFLDYTPKEPILEFDIKNILFSLFSCNLATLASYLPSYDDIKSTVTNNDFFRPIKTLLFKDWPQDEIYPASIEDFVRRMYDTRFSIFNAIFWNTTLICEKYKNFRPI